jgi:hypothetical protein
MASKIEDLRCAAAVLGAEVAGVDSHDCGCACSVAAGTPLADKGEATGGPLDAILRLHVASRKEFELLPNAA